MMNDSAITRDSHDDQWDREDTHLWQFARDVAGSLLSPADTLREVGERRAVVPAMMLILLIVGISATGQITVLLLTLAEAPGFDTGISGFPYAPVAAMQLTGILWNFVWMPVLWVIIAAITYGVVHLLGGRGSFMALWAATGFALTPQLLVAPLSTVNELMSVLGPGWMIVSLIFVIPVTIAAFFWSLALYVIAIRETMSVSTGRAVGSVAILLGAFMLIGILLMCAFMLVIVGLIAAVAA